MKKIKKLLIENGLTISVAESLTSGILQSKIAKTSGASSFYVGGITAYNIRQKVEHLYVDEKEARLCNCVSELVSSQMASGVAKMFDSDIGISTTGYAEPDILNNVALPYAHISIWFNGITFNKKLVGTVEMTRTQMRNYVADELLKELPGFVSHVIESKDKTVQDLIDSGEIVLKPHKTVVGIDGLLNRKAPFIRSDKKHGYIFEDSFGELIVNVRFCSKLVISNLTNLIPSRKMPIYLSRYSLLCKK